MSGMATTQEINTLQGKITNIIYSNAENGFSIFKIKLKTPSNKRRKADIGKADIETAMVKGTAPPLQINQEVTCKGDWKNDQKYGLQFQANSIIQHAPKTRSGMEQYLSSMVEGIGETLAKRIVETFGVNTLKIIKNDPKRLLEISGINEEKLENIIKVFKEQEAIREIIVFLGDHGITTNRALTIFKKYEHNAISEITKNPYCLIEIDGIGFKFADKLALSLGIAEDSYFRITAGIEYILNNATNQGHCAMHLDELISEVEEQLSLYNTDSSTIIFSAIKESVKQNRIVSEKHDDETLIYLTKLYIAECGIAKKLYQMSCEKPSWQNLINVEEEIENLKENHYPILKDKQLEAIEAAITNKIVIITGGPGVGKTTIAKNILKILSGVTEKIYLCAPTGKAAKRLGESTGMDAKTIHRVLGGCDKGFKFNAKNPLDAKLVLVDEVSMIPLPLFYNLISALPSDCTLILIGDANQLSAIGAGNVLNDLITSNNIYTVVLNEIHRQAAESEIIINAHRINNGLFPLENNYTKAEDFYFFKDEVGSINFLPTIIEWIENNFKFDFNDIQILSPMKKRNLGSLEINDFMQTRYNPNVLNLGVFDDENAREVKAVKVLDKIWALDDKVIQIKNNYKKEVFNGEIGKIISIDSTYEGMPPNQIKVDFGDKKLNYSFGELEELQLAYALTIHKSQGSEYPVVIIPVFAGYSWLLRRKLIYTAVTRGKQLVIIWGQKEALQDAIDNLNEQKRITRLSERIREKFNSCNSYKFSIL
jgi:exodeoxyribonuclease V alpha subunit